jgi:hypothetical protein
MQSLWSALPLPALPMVLAKALLPPLLLTLAFWVAGAGQYHHR